MKLWGIDFETRGEGDAFGLQPWRVLENKAEITSFAVVDEDGCTIFGELMPTVERLRTALKAAVEEDVTLIGWNTAFDVSWLIAVGLEKEVRACRWLDGEIMCRAFENDTSNKSYGLKPTIAKYLPEYAGYENLIGGEFECVNE